MLQFKQECKCSYEWTVTKTMHVQITGFIPHYLFCIYSTLLKEILVKNYINLKHFFFFYIFADKLWKHHVRPSVRKFRSAVGNTLSEAVFRRGVVLSRKYFQLNNFLIKKKWLLTYSSCHQLMGLFQIFHIWKDYFSHLAQDMLIKGQVHNNAGPLLNSHMVCSVPKSNNLIF